MAQQFLDPCDIPLNTGACKAPHVLPPAVRKMGHIPDASLLQPGDLILICPARDARSVKSFAAAIHRFQLKGGFADHDARWHHAAVYIGTGFEVVEARAISGVTLGSMLDYLPDHCIRVRRPSATTRDQGWRLAINAVKLLGQPYSATTIAALAKRAVKGFWKPEARRAVEQGVVCSIVYGDAYSATYEGRVLGDPVIPATLSATERLTDVPLRWLRVG